MTSIGGNRQRLLAVWPHKCVFVVEEILKTEEDYVESLRQIIEVTDTRLLSFSIHVEVHNSVMHRYVGQRSVGPQL